MRLFPNFVFPGLIALAVAIADEVHQKYIPNRDASVTDVMLDVVGITTAMLLAIHFYKKDKSPMSRHKR
jgi:VanZ family protein